MRPLRIAYVPASLRPGGAERQMLHLAERLPKDRFKVDFVTIAGTGEYDDRARAAGATVRTLGAGGDPRANPIARSLNRVTKIGRYISTIRRSHYDIVDAWLYPTDVLAALVRPLTGTPVVISGRRNVDAHDQFGPLEHPLESLVLRLTDVVVANSAAVAEHTIRTQGVAPEKVRIIRNGVVVPRPATADERATVRRELVGDDDRLVIGCVANYRDVKRLDRLVAATASLVAEGLPVRLELIGDGPMRPDLERQMMDAGLTDAVCLHGSVPDAERLYPAFDIVVQSSEREGLPNALLEAGGAGRAIVATAAGGSAEIVIDGQTGLLVPVDDAAALAAAIRRLVTDGPLRERLGAAAYEHVLSAFGMDRFVKEFGDLYESMAIAKHVRR